MNLDFFTSIAIIALIFFILSSGFKFFLNLKQELDFSYIAIIIFGSYASVIINNTWQTGILASAGLAFLLAIIFTFFILYLSSKLSEVYFIIGTLSLYMISLHLARNLEITG
ncbi:MAG: hypothetical protein H6767_02045 [Candidatus Peribacteria bacterium]|nr:MAG: hypothetical protein H6767_02045 [Candidatus Peribacteria bacterium]